MKPVRINHLPYGIGKCKYYCVLYVASLLFASICYYLIIWRAFYNILLMFVFFFVYLFSSLCILYFCIVLYTVSPLVYSCLFPIFVQVYRPLPPSGNPIAVNKYRIISNSGSCKVFCCFVSVKPGLSHWWISIRISVSGNRVLRKIFRR